MERVYHQWQRLPYEIYVEHEIWIYSFPNMLEIAEVCHIPSIYHSVYRQLELITHEVTVRNPRGQLTDKRRKNRSGESKHASKIFL
jgi:hypothetical protein